jgi:asparagine synthase (glutamine-hydrolysing)
MCGIAGIVNFSRNPSRARVEKMTSMFIHRGPDSGGIVEHNHCILGHRRLSILDLTVNGNQPMVDLSLGLSIVFNGEIYNFKILREKLEKECLANFVTNSDTEVLLKGFYFWGIEKLCKSLEGMFSFAIWSEDAQKLFIARDRFGEKPFYFMNENNNFLFSSFAKSITSTSESSFELNPIGLISYLNLGYSVAPFHTINNLQTLEPACFGILSKDGLQKTNYWDLPSSGSIIAGNPTENIEDLLLSSVGQQLISDVPIGCLLSGGVDSSLVASMATQLESNLSLFTVRMPGSKFDESELAKKIARRIGGTHYVVDAKPIDENEFIQFMGQFSEPLGDASALGVYMVSKEASKSVKVVLTGDGGDEFFAGYKTIDLNLKFADLRKFTANPIFKHLNDILTGLFKLGVDKPIIRKALTYTSLIAHTHKEFHIKKSLLPLGFSGIYGPKLKSQLFQRTFTNHLESVWDKSNFQNSFDKQLYYDIKTDLLGDYLPKVDTASMAHSIEARAPFLSYKLAEAAFNLNLEEKRMGNTSKGILKELLKKRIGNEIWKEVVAEKKGFVMPIDHWIDDSWKDLTNQLIKSPLIEDGYLNQKQVIKVVENAKKYPTTYSRIRYSLIALDSWYRSFK